MADPFLQILPGTAIAATIDAVERPFIIRVWHRGPQGNLREVYWDSRNEPWANRKSHNRLNGRFC